MLAFILAPLVEQYYFISTRMHGWEWIIKPAPFVIRAFTAALLIFLSVRSIRRTRKSMADGQNRAFRPSLDADTLPALAVCGVLPAVPLFTLAYMLTAGESWRLASPVAVVTSAATYFLFIEVLSLAWPAPIWNVLGWIGWLWRRAGVQEGAAGAPRHGFTHNTRAAPPLSSVAVSPERAGGPDASR